MGKAFLFGVEDSGSGVDWQPNPTWWDIETIYKADIPPTGFHKVAIMLLLAQGNTTLFSTAIITGCSMYRANDMLTAAALGSHTWDIAQDKSCLIDGIEVYKTRYIILYSDVPATVVVLQTGAITYAVTTPIPIYAYIKRMAPSTSVTLQFGGSSGQAQHYALEGVKVVRYDLTSLTTISSSAFAYCTSLTSIIIPDSVTSIGSYAFRNCSSLTSIIIPDRVTSIGSNAFYNCTSLTSIIIPDSVTSIGGDAFWNCTSLTSIIIPDSVTSIAAYAFENCSSLTSITIPDSVTSIGSYAFYSCSSLTDFTVFPNFDLAISLAYSPLLSINSILALFNNLKDNTLFTAKTLTLGTINLDKMTTAEKLIATNKNWTLA